MHCSPNTQSDPKVQIRFQRIYQIIIASRLCICVAYPHMSPQLADSQGPQLADSWGWIHGESIFPLQVAAS